jgi:flagellar assembly protein FliH
VGEFPFTVSLPDLPSRDPEGELEDAQERAQRILAEARTQADRMREEAEREITTRRANLDSEVRDAVERGREQGHAEGISLARQEVVEQAKDAVAQIRETAEALFAERKRAWREQEREIVDMAIRVAEKVIRDQVEVDREMILRVTREAISRAAEKDKLVIRIHPEDLVILEDYVADLREEFRSLGQVQIEEDRRINRGGCVVESRSGYIDATLESQIHQVRRELGLME